MAGPDEIFDVIVQMGMGRDGRAQIPIGDLAERVTGSSDEVPAGEIAELMERGDVEVWSGSPGSEPVIVLTPLAAQRLKLRLMPDSSRWVARKARIPLPRRKPRKRLISEADLDDEADTPLDEHPDRNSVEAQDEQVAYENMLDMRRSLSPHDQRAFDHYLPPLIFMMGVPAHPLPLQDRGPLAPTPIPTETDLDRMRRPGAIQARPGGKCYVCRGAKLKINYSCLCSRWYNDFVLTGKERANARKKVKSSHRPLVDRKRRGVEGDKESA